jgi:hypothetical protein
LFLCWLLGYRQHERLLKIERSVRHIARVGPKHGKVVKKKETGETRAKQTSAPTRSALKLLLLQVVSDSLTQPSSLNPRCRCALLCERVVESESAFCGCWAIGLSPPVRSLRVFAPGSLKLERMITRSGKRISHPDPPNRVATPALRPSQKGGLSLGLWCASSAPKAPFPKASAPSAGASVFVVGKVSGLVEATRSSRKLRARGGWVGRGMFYCPFPPPPRVSLFKHFFILF